VLSHPRALLASAATCEGAAPVQPSALRKIQHFRGQPLTLICQPLPDWTAPSSFIARRIAGVKPLAWPSLSTVSAA
jgi:hypothetical protein